MSKVSSIIMSTDIQEAIEQAEAVLFDFDGVILDTEWAIFQTWRELFKREGHELALELYVRCIGSDFDTWSPQSYLEELTGKTFDWDTENAARQVKLEDDIEGNPPMAGVLDLLVALKSKKTAVVSSSTHHWVDRWIAELELNPYFETIVCKGDAPKIKPAPDLYLEGARQLGVDPSKCLVIEDSMNGMISAHKAGMKVLVVPNRLTEIIDFAAADYQASSLAECVPSS